MGNKDHLSTRDESDKRQKRDFKRVSSVVYQGNPPIFTEGLDQIGLKARTTGEVRDTDFPILKDIDDQTQNILVDDATDNLTYTIDLSLQEAHFHRLLIADVDTDSDPITNIDVNFINLPKNKELQFTIEFVKDPAMVATPTITFSPALGNALAQPTPFPDDFDVWYFLISARTLPDNTTRFELLNFGTGSGAGNTFPILYPEENLGTIGFITQLITVSGTDGQFKEITMNGDVDIAFAGLPAGTVLEEWWILFIQDNVGGHGLTSTTSTLKNAGLLNSLIDKAADARTLFHFATGDGGTSIHGDLVDLTAAGGGFSGNLSDLVIDVDKDWNEKNISNLGTLSLFSNSAAHGIFFVDVVTFISNAGASRGQFGRSDFFGTADGLTANIMAADNFIVSVDTIEKFRIDSALGEVRLDYPLNMKGNRIIIDAGGNSSIGSPAFFVNDQIDFITASTIGMSLTSVGFAIFKNTTIIGNVEILSAGFLSLLSGGQIFAGGAGKGMENIGNLVFVSNLATPGADVAIYSDGTFLKAKSNALAGNIFLTSAIEDLNMNNFNIKSTATPTGGNQFRIIFDAHEDSDTFIANSATTADRINVIVADVNVFQFNATEIILNSAYNINMNGGDVKNVGNMDFGGGSATSGRIRLPAGGGGAIKWPTVPASGFHGEMYFDNDFNWFVDTGGEYKYFIGGFERFRIDDFIEMFANVDMNNNDIVKVQNIAFNDLGGQIAVSLNVFQFVTTSPLGIFRFTPQITDILDITEDGLLMKGGNLDLANTNLLRVNELQFTTSGQIIFDGPAALTIAVGANDTIDFIVNSVPGFQVNQSFCDFFDSFWDMTQRLGPIFNPPVNQRRIFVNPATEELSVITPTGSIISLEQGGGGASFYQFVADEGVLLEQRQTTNFVGAGVEVTDVAGVTTVTIAGGGGSTEGDNVGIGTGEIFRDKTVDTLNFRTLIGGTNVTITTNTDDITIDATGGGGGSGLGTVTDVIVSLTVHPDSDQGFLDVNNYFFGNDNGFEAVGISLGTSNPATPTVTYTLTAGDLPNGGGDFAVSGTGTKLGASLGFSVANSGSSTKLVVQGYRNGNAYGSPQTSTGADIANGQSARGLTFDNSTTWSVGDTIGVALWSTGGAGLTLENYAIWFQTNNLVVIVNTITSNFLSLGDNEKEITAPLPAGGTSIETVNFEAIAWDVMNSDGFLWPPTFTGDGLHILKGNRLTNSNNFNNNGSTRVTSGNLDIGCPSIPQVRFYQTTSD